MRDGRDLRIKRLLYRSRSTGTKELDLWLSRFAESHLRDLSDIELDEYEAILTRPGEELWRWLAEPSADGRDGPVAGRLRAFRPGA